MESATAVRNYYVLFVRSIVDIECHCVLAYPYNRERVPQIEPQKRILMSQNNIHINNNVDIYRF